MTFDNPNGREIIEKLANTDEFYFRIVTPVKRDRNYSLQIKKEKVNSALQTKVIKACIKGKLGNEYIPKPKVFIDKSVLKSNVNIKF